MRITETTVLTLLLERGDRDSLARVERAFQLAQGNIARAAKELGVADRTVKRWLHGDPLQGRDPLPAVVRLAKAAGWDPPAVGPQWHAARRQARIRRMKREAERRRGRP
jgi:hypothetical protein